ncbi:MAG: DNA/RNA nuclease SfsA [Pseudomonadota bacterium]
MEFPEPLIKATLIKRYKRFLADVTLGNGEVVTAHVANSGRMTGVSTPGSPVWLLPNRSKTAKLKYRWELIEADDTLVGINTGRPNTLVEEAITNGTIEPLQGYESLRREVKYGVNSRIDILLEGPGTCFVEVKNVHMREGDKATFPDAVTARGLKHLKEMTEMVNAGHRAVMIYCIQRGDCTSFDSDDAVDPAYGAGLRQALKDGVEAYAYTCDVSLTGIRIKEPLPLRLTAQERPD